MHGKVFRFGGSTGPEESLNTVLEISNPTKRREVFDSAMERHTTSQATTWPQSARDWMDMADIPEWRVK